MIRIVTRIALVTGALGLALVATPAVTVAATGPSVDQGLRALAQVQSASNPRAALAAMSPSDQKSLALAMQGVQTKFISGQATPIVPTANAGSVSPMYTTKHCWYADMTVREMNITGMILWDYTQEIRWCDNGTKIVADTYGPNHFRSAANLAFLWYYDQTPTSWSTWGGVGYASYESYTSAHFCENIPLYNNCFQNFYPWIDSFGYRGGSMGGSKGGN